VGETRQQLKEQEKNLGQCHSPSSHRCTTDRANGGTGGTGVLYISSCEGCITCYYPHLNLFFVASFTSLCLKFSRNYRGAFFIQSGGYLYFSSSSVTLFLPARASHLHLLHPLSSGPLPITLPPTFSNAHLRLWSCTDRTVHESRSDNRRGGIVVTLLASPHRRQERRGDPGICTGRFSRRDWPVDRDGREGPSGGGSVLFSFVTAAGGRSEEGEASRARERGES
jgi:hypothetical protein